MTDMLFGDANLWRSRFVGVDLRLIRRISVVWPKCISRLGLQPSEDRITINLVEALCKDRIVRRMCHWVEYQFEPFGLCIDGTSYSKGKIDMAAILDWDRQRYVAYECKRLNVSYEDGRSSLANRYVDEGLMRFVTEQYAESLPVGCMLGYVIDGDTSYASRQIRRMMLKRHSKLRLKTGPLGSNPVKDIKRFRTTHSRADTGSLIEVRHALLPFRRTSAAE